MPGGLSFAAPWVFVALAILPALWWLLRVSPPSPRRQPFPAVTLLLGLSLHRETAARTPPWLVALRFLLAVMIIVGAAHPLIDAVPPGVGGPLLIVVDNGWASARSWQQRRTVLERLLDREERSGQPVALLATAPAPDGSGVAVSGLAPVGETRARAGALEPRPWPVDRKSARRALSTLPGNILLRVVWLANGLADEDSQDFAEALRRLGPLEIVTPGEGGTARLLMPPETGSSDPAPTAWRVAIPAPGTATVVAADSAGRVLMRQTAAFPANAASVRVPFPMPPELRNRVARFVIEGEDTAGAVVLLDERFRRRPVGLIDRGGSGTSPLLDDLFYAGRALAPVAEVRKGALAELLKREVSLLVLPDGGRLGDDEKAMLEGWIEKGGVLVRLAGPKLAHNPDDLLPVRLLGGGRTLGGAMSWTKPMTLAPMGDQGPFAGLAVSPDLKVRAQVLAEPAVDLADKTWARLSDGTPLVTAAPRGGGWLVLIHTTVWPEWSDLGLSGLFPEMMERLLNLSRGVGGPAADKPLPPQALLDGFGHLAPPGGIAEPLLPNAPPPRPGPRHPPGYYGRDQAREAFNLAPGLAALRPLALPPGVAFSTYGGRPVERDLQPLFLGAALVLLLLDMAAVLVLAGAWRGRRGRVLLLAAAVLGAGVFPLSSRAAGGTSGAGAPTAEDAALVTRLAYVVTGDPGVDEISRAGLEGLSQVMARRTTAVLGDPAGVDPGRDALMVYPLLYWPVTESQPAPGAAAREAINDFLRHGGMVLFDTRDRGEGGPGNLRRLTGGIDIPPLTPVTDQHVLSHSFYILRDYPGRWTGAPVYVENGGDPANDNVSPVVIGGNDWASAWAVDRNGDPMFAVVPGGERQREMAYRFGVNLVMYALTGSYKADQVHLPAILERMRR